MPDHAMDLHVAKLLRHRRALFGVCRIVFGHEFKLGRFATDLQALGVQIRNGHAGAVFIVFAKGRLRPRQGRDMADFDADFACGESRSGSK